MANVMLTKTIALKFKNFLEIVEKMMLRKVKKNDIRKSIRVIKQYGI